MARRKEKKYYMDLPDYPSWFLPAPHRVAELLGIPATINGFLKYMDIPVGDYLQKDALFNYQKSGVGKGVYHQIKHFTQEICGSAPAPSLGQARIVKNSMKLRSNAALWQSLLRVMSADPLQLNKNPVMAYIEERAQADLRLRRDVIEQKIDKDDVGESLSFTHSFILDHTLIRPDLLSHFEKVCLKVKASTDEGNLIELLETGVRFNSTLYADFYLSLLACFEIWRSDLFSGANCNGQSGSFLSLIVNQYYENEHKTFFESWLDILKDELGHETNSRSTWQALAQSISLSKKGNKDSDASYEERQRQQMKDWRRGSFPSDDSLFQFCQNLSRKLPNRSEDELFDISITVMVFDKLPKIIADELKKIAQQTNSQYVQQLSASTIDQFDFYELFRPYPKYFAYFEQHHC